MGERISLREFARRKGWNPGYAHKLKEAGRLVLVDGQVDYEASLKLLEESADPARAHLRRGGDDAPAAESSPAAESDAPAAPAGGAPGGVPLSQNSTFNKARTADQVFVARMRELDYKERIGELVSARDVEQLQFTAGRITRDRMEMVPQRFGAEVHALVLRLVPEEVRPLVAEKFQVLDCETRLRVVIRELLREADKAIEEAARGDDDDE